jgi:hypothetical protein
MNQGGDKVYRAAILISRICLQHLQRARNMAQILETKFIARMKVLPPNQAIELLKSLFDIYQMHPNTVNYNTLQYTAGSYEEFPNVVKDVLLEGWCKIFYSGANAAHLPCMDIVVQEYLEREASFAKEICRSFLFGY